jgi:hypothetical protein
VLPLLLPLLLVLPPLVLPPPVLPHGFVVGHAGGPLFGNSQQTETHWLPVTTTVAVLVSVAPAPLSMPGAAAPPFCVTPNHGSGPIVKAELAGVTTIVAVLPVATDAVTDAAVDAAPPSIVTEHQLRKFRTWSVTSRFVLASGALGASNTAASTGAAGAAGAAGAGDELLLHATAPAIASAAMLPIPLHPIRFIVNMARPPIGRTQLLSCGRQKNQWPTRCVLSVLSTLRAPDRIPHFDVPVVKCSQLATHESGWLRHRSTARPASAGCEQSAWRRRSARQRSFGA